MHRLLPGPLAVLFRRIVLLTSFLQPAPTFSRWGIRGFGARLASLQLFEQMPMRLLAMLAFGMLLGPCLAPLSVSHRRVLR